MVSERITAMNRISSDRAVDLPAAPLRTTMDEGPLDGARVTAYLLDGTNQQGRLKQLSVANDIFIVQVETNEDIVQIPFSSLHFLIFSKKLLIGGNHHPIESGCRNFEMPNRFQNFKVISTGNKKKTGKTFGSFADMSGLHLFEVIESRYTQRIFFPSEKIEKYQMGKLIGEELLTMSSAAVEPKDIDSALKIMSLDREKTTSISTKDGGDLIEIRGQDEQDPETKKRLGSYLKEMGVVTDIDLQRALAQKSGIPFIDLEDCELDSKAISLLSREIAYQYCVLPIRFVDQTLIIAIDDPFNKETIDIIQFITNCHLDLILATKKDIDSAIARHYKAYDFPEDLREAEDTSLPQNSDVEPEDHIEQPIVRVVSSFLLDAAR